VNVRWLRAAERDRYSQLVYIAERNPWAAIDLGDAITAGAARLAEFPLAGRIGRVKKTRELVISGTPYLLVYTIRTNELVIVRLLHGAQLWPKRS
jgi:toxin ParE1/3/4